MFTDKGYIVTGGSSGIGLAIAQKLHKEGARLSLWARRIEPLKAAAAPLDAHYASVDVADAGRVRAAMQEAAEALGGIHGVINSAGVLITGDFTSIPIEQHQMLVDVNLAAPITLAHAAFPYLQQTGGSLVLLASGVGYHGVGEFASYGAAKAGLLSLTQALDMEWRHQGVHIGVVMPGLVRTAMTAQGSGNYDTKLFRFVERAGFTHTPEQVARATLHAIRRRRTVTNPGTIFVVAALTGPFRRLYHAIFRQIWRRL